MMSLPDFFERGSGKLKVEWPDEKFTVGIYRHDGRLVHSDGPADGSYVWGYEPYTPEDFTS